MPFRALRSAACLAPRCLRHARSRGLFLPVVAIPAAVSILASISCGPTLAAKRACSVLLGGRSSMMQLAPRQVPMSSRSLHVAVAAKKKNEVNRKITPRSEDWSAWYLDIIEESDLVDDAPVRGCKVLKPNGLAIWEGIRALLDPEFKTMGVENAYFPLLIPLEFFSKEADHVEGFATECAVVTHHRLKRSENTSGIEIDPESRLEDPYVIRPTSETIIWHMYSKWISSYRDLPMKMNQWVNVMRWERRTKPFLRSAEFLWQEGHTAHATEEEADAQARQVLDVYAEMAQRDLLLPLVPGRKSENERFAGAVETYTIEALMQNGMALQAGTSHFLGQNFAKAFDVTYLTEKQKSEYVWSTSWGVSTRLVGAVIMVHSDDDGLIMPPALAKIQVVIVPIPPKSTEVQAQIEEAAAALESKLTSGGLRAHFDNRQGLKPGNKYYDWERKGVPLRLELGAKDLEKGSVLAKMRTGGKKFAISLEEDVVEGVQDALEKVKEVMWERSQALKEKLQFKITSKEEFLERMNQREPGFLWVPWGGDGADEESLQEETGATLRCIPFEQDPIPEGQVCPLTGKPAKQWAVFASSY